jgi:hypothetical protein
MITTEDRARAAMQAIGNTVRDAPPLELAPRARDLPAADEVQLGDHRPRRLSLHRPGGAARPGRRGVDRRWRPRLAPIAAAVAVAAVAIALVTIRDFPNGRVASPSPSTTSVGPAGRNVIIPGLPEYYVAWMQADAPYLVVGDTATGKQVGEVGPVHNVDLAGIYGAAANDRTFVVMGDRLFGPPHEGRAVFYLLHIDPGGSTPSGLTRISIAPQPNPAGVAISPDGTELAIASAGSPATVRIYSIATGELLRSWSATGPGALAVEPASVAKGSQFTTARVLRWSADGRQLAFAWNSSAIRVLDVSTPDGNLITSSSVLAAIGTTGNKDSSVTCNAAQGWELIAGGQIGGGQGVICGGSARAKLPVPSAAHGGACTTRDGRTLIGFLEETNGGQGGLPVELTDSEPECSANPGYPDGAYIGWANAGGTVLIGTEVWDGHARFGEFRDGRFTALPALPVSVPVPAGVLLGTYAW